MSDDAAPKKRGRVENLKPKTSASARGRLGGIAAAKANTQRKLVSQIIGEWLAKEHDVPIYDPITGKIVDVSMSTEDLFDRAINSVMGRGDSATASMIKTLAEINEGKTINLPGLTLDMTPEERAARIAELEAKRKAKK